MSSYHFLDVEKLYKDFDPFRFPVWAGIHTVPKTKIRKFIHEEKFSKCSGPNDEFDCDNPWTQSVHIQKIAWLVKNRRFTDPKYHIWLDFEYNWPILDGNHRYTAACYRGDQKIIAFCEGPRSLIDLYRWRKNK